MKLGVYLFVLFLQVYVQTLIKDPTSAYSTVLPMFLDDDSGDH